MYGISYRKFDYKKEANLNVEELPDCIRIEYIYSGAAQISQDGKDPKKLNIGSYVITNAREYIFQSCEKEGAEIFIFYIYDLPRLIPKSSNLLTSEIYYSSPTMAAMVHSLFHHTFTDDSYPILYYQTIYSFLSGHVVTVQNQEVKGRYYHEVMQVAHVIRTQLEKRYTIKELAAIVGVNRTTIQLQFKLHNNMTINDFLYNYRNELVKHLLSHTDKLLDEIAKLTGYCHAPHLVKDFSDQHKLTPNQWRQLNYRTYESKII